MAKPLRIINHILIVTSKTHRRDVTAGKLNLREKCDLVHTLNRMKILDTLLQVIAEVADVQNDALQPACAFG